MKNLFLILAVLQINHAFSQVGGNAPISVANDATCAGCSTLPVKISIADAQANSSNKGASTYLSNDFDDNGTGLISIDYLHGQAAGATQNGFVNQGTQTWSGLKTFSSNLTITGTKLILPNGSTSIPSFTFTGAGTTGLSWSSGGGVEALHTSFTGAENFEFTSQGRLVLADIWYSSPAAKLGLNIYHDAYLYDGSNGQDGGINVTTFGGSLDINPKLHTSTFTGRTASGTYNNPLQTKAGQAMAEFTGRGYYETGGIPTDFDPSNRGVFGVYAANNQTDVSQGAFCVIQTTKTGNYPVSGITDHYSMLVDPNGNAGLTWLQTGGFGTSLPTGWGSDDDAKFFSIESSEPTKDIGLLIQNGDATNTTHGTVGINLWYDNSANTTYIDNIKSSGTPYLITRFQTLGTPINAITTSLTGTNFGGDLTPDNQLTVGSSSEFQISSAGKVAEYNLIPTVSNGIPSEVATIDLTGQNTTLGPTTIYAVPSTGEGLYRISWVATVTTAAGTSSTLGDFQVKYSDTNGGTAQTKLTNTINNITKNSTNNTQTAVISGTYVVYAKASTNIQYVMDYSSSGSPAMLYNLHIKCEAL